MERPLGVKIDFAFDLLSGTIVFHSLKAATERNKSIGTEFPIEVLRNDLMLRDMGYFVHDDFIAFELLEDWRLTRLPLTTGVMLDDGNTLEKTLKSFHRDMIDLEVFVGQQGQKCRLMLTVLDQAEAEVSQLTTIHRARWAGETQFRAWKQALNLGMRLGQQIRNMIRRARLSDEKLYDLLAVRLIKSRDLADFAAFDPDPRHITRDKRTRKSPIESDTLALT